MNTWKSVPRFTSENKNEWIADCVRPIHNQVYADALDALATALNESEELQLINKTTGEIIWNK